MQAKNIEHFTSIKSEEQEAYDLKLKNALDNTTLTFSSNEVNANYKNDCIKYDNSVLHGAKLLEEEGFRFPDMRGI